LRANAVTRRQFFYSFGRLAGGAYDGFNNAVLGLYVSAFTNNPFIIGYLGNTRTMEGAVIQPLVGRWSDRTASPLGRRRPFILVAAPLSVFFLLLIPFLGHTGRRLALPLVAVSIMLFSVTWNVAADPYDALMVDMTPPRRRPVFNAILNIVSLAGQVGIVLFVSIASLRENNIPDTVFYVCAALILASYAIVFLGVREPRRRTEVAGREEAISFHSYIGEIRGCREAFKLLAGVFFLWNGSSAVLPFLTIFIVKNMHATKSQALTVYVVAILASAICMYPFGRLGARHGSRPFIVLGTVLLIIAAGFGLVVPSYTWLFPEAILIGTGFAATNALTYPYLSQLVPASRIGVFTGLKTSFQAAALPVSILATGTIVACFGYRSIFAVLAVMMACDLACLLSIDEVEAQRQVKDSERDPVSAGTVKSQLNTKKKPEAGLIGA
jgi:maltose/moltooligosaccharide transporter